MKAIAIGAVLAGGGVIAALAWNYFDPAERDPERTSQVSQHSGHVVDAPIARPAGAPATVGASADAPAEDVAAVPTESEAGPGSQGREDETDRTGESESGATPEREAPSFDVVRVDAEGQTVIAGKARPNETVEVLLDGEVVEKVLADASGKFVAVIMADISSEARELRLRVTRTEESPPRTMRSAGETASDGGLSRGGASLASDALGSPASRNAKAAGRSAQLPLTDAEASAEPPDDAGSAPAVGGGGAEITRAGTTAPDVSSDQAAARSGQASRTVTVVPSQSSAASVRDGSASPSGAVGSQQGSTAETTETLALTATPDPQNTNFEEMAEGAVALLAPNVAAPNPAGADPTDQASTGTEADAPPRRPVSSPMRPEPGGVGLGVPRRDGLRIGSEPFPADGDAAERGESEGGEPRIQTTVQGAAEDARTGAEKAPAEAVSSDAASVPLTESATGEARGDTPPEDESYEVSEPVIILPAPERQGAPALVQPRDDEFALLQPSGGKPDGVALDQITHSSSGDIQMRGRARPGHAVRVYGNGRLLETVAVTNGAWQLSVGRELAEGILLLRFDEIGPTGTVASRIEAPVRHAPPTPQTLRERSVVIQKGDNLWTIARQHYGKGIRYSLIYGANSELIRDPDLIYPDQVFTIPELVDAQ